MRSFTVGLKIFLDGDAFPAERSLIRLFWRIESGKGVDAENGNQVSLGFRLAQPMFTALV